MSSLPPSLGFRQPVLDARAYVPDWSGMDRDGYLRLDRNEGTRPIPSSVAEAIVDYVVKRGVHTYPDSDVLRAPLARYCGVTEESVLPTNGSDQAIDLTLRAFLREGRSMVVARPEFPVFGHVAGLTGAEIRSVPYDDEFRFPYAEFRAAAASRPDLIVLINPNNPTGTKIDADFIAELLRTYPEIPVIVDEAYYEFTGETVAELTRSHENLIVFRTFSKAFAMAGLRLGYVVADPGVLTEITKLRNPFDVNELAVVAAKAHLMDLGPARAFCAETMNVVKPMVVAGFRELGVKVWPGAANFLLVKSADCDEAVTRLRAEKILVRPMKAPALTGTFRMSLGTYEEMTRTLAVYREYLRNP